MRDRASGLGSEGFEISDGLEVSDKIAVGVSAGRCSRAGPKST